LRGSRWGDNLRVEQAIFGEHRGGHALREASGDRRFANELSPRLDLPDTAPSGIEWSPFISGFSQGDRYVVARTFLDPEAPRAGMVLSHALIVPLQEVSCRANLLPLFDRLLSGPYQPAGLASFDVELDERQPPASPDLVGAAEALTTRGHGPVVRPGVERFDDLIVALWARLLPEIRATFAYRLSFGPSDIFETPPPALVCTPIALVTRWRGYRIVDSSTRDPASISASLLSGGAAGQPMLAFASDIGAEMRTFGEFPLLEQAYRLAVVEPDTFGNTTAALRLVEKLSLDPKKGDAGKVALLNRLSLHIDRADANSILTIRNLQLDAFEQREEIWAQVRRWTGRNTFPAAQDSGFLSIVEDISRETGALAPWRAAMTKGLRAASQVPSSDFASALWRWAQLKPSILNLLMDLVEFDAPLQSRLIKVAPRTLGHDAANAMMLVAKERQLRHLHGVAVSAAYAAPEAVRLQIAMEGETRSAEGLAFALRNARPPEVIACALEIVDEPRLIDLAGKVAADQPTLLESVDMGSGPAQAVWQASLSRNPAAWRGPSDPRLAFNQVLMSMLNGGPVDHGLLAALAATPLADLSNFERRKEVWSRVNGVTRNRLVGATAKNWIDQSRTGSVLFSLDDDLQHEVLASRELSDALDGLSANGLAKGIQIVAALPSFDEHRFMRWVQTVTARTRAVTVADAEVLGRLTLDRRWHLVADELVSQLRRGREDLRPALRVCISLLGLFTRWSLNLSSLTSTEKWDSFEAVAADLYPSGPDHNELWERAGGSDADLPRNGNGRSRWHDTLGQMRRGGRRLKVDRLLREMQKDYPLNRELPFFAGDYEFGGRR
jgi:hypothetical protein